MKGANQKCNKKDYLTKNLFYPSFFNQSSSGIYSISPLLVFEFFNAQFFSTLESKK